MIVYLTWPSLRAWSCEGVLDSSGSSNVAFEMTWNLCRGAKIIKRADSNRTDMSNPSFQYKKSLIGVREVNLNRELHATIPSTGILRSQ